MEIFTSSGSYLSGGQPIRLAYTANWKSLETIWYRLPHHVELGTKFAIGTVTSAQYIRGSYSFSNLSNYTTADPTGVYLRLTGRTMANTNVVVNMNADLLDGYQASTTSNAANRIPVRDVNGYMQTLDG